MILNSNFPNVLDPGHKAYQDSFEEGFGNAPSVAGVLFIDRFTQKADETVVSLSDLPEPSLRTPGGSIATVEMEENWKATFAVAEYAAKTVIDKSTWEDLPDAIRGAHPAAYGKAFNSKAEGLAASVVSGGFAATGPDGKAIFATDHPRADGGTWSNLLTTALSATALAAVRTAVYNQLSPMGRVQSNPAHKYLVVPPTLESTGAEILDYKLLGYTAASKAGFTSNLGMELVVWPELGLVSTKDWYTFANPADMVRAFEMFWRTSPQYNGAFNEEGMYYWMNGRMRLVAGAVDVRAAFGNDVA